MRLSKHDLFQMDDEWLKKLPAELLLEVSKRLLHDVKELQDRLNQNPTNSSRPPSSQGTVGEGPRPGRGTRSAGRERHGRRRAKRHGGRFAERDGKRPAANVPTAHRPERFGEAAGQATRQSGPWSHAETGGYRHVRAPTRELRGLW
jgi:hypothetical protein